MPPSAPTITTPAASPYLSNGSALTIAGACTTGDTVVLSGDDNQTMACVNSAYSFVINKTVDTTYVFSILQTSPAGYSSTAVSQTWKRSTVTPVAVTVASPAASPYYASSHSLTLTGGCVTGDLVSLGGASSQSMTCASSQYSFALSQSSDGAYTYSLAQTDAYGNSSTPVTFKWVVDTVAPAAPGLSIPASNPYTSNSSTLEISGSCEPSAAVNLTGDATANGTCSASGSYDLLVSKSIDGTYSFTLNQTDLAGNTSSPLNVSWTRNTVIPPTPTISTPSASPYYSSGSSFTLSGGCVTGETITLGGNVTASEVTSPAGALSTSPAGALSTSCASSSYSFAIAKSADGNYSFTLAQTDSVGNTSGLASVTWVRDTVPPAAVTVTSPVANPYVSGDSAITIQGTCENQATIVMTGAGTALATCTAGAFSFPVSESADGTYDFTLTQTDPAGNSSPSVVFEWVRDTSIPATPTISSPSQNPQYSNSSTLTIAGSCVTGYVVNLTGDSTQQLTCSGSAYSFAVTETVDRSYSFAVTQTNSNTQISSAQATLTWVRDTVAPAAPAVTTPSTNPYTSSSNLTITGTCETGATVKLSGGDSQTTTCASSNFTFVVSPSLDGTYTFQINQADAAGNVSSGASLTWVRDSSVPATPTITLPASNPYTSNGSSLLITGQCTTGLTVSISGDLTATDVSSPAGSLTTTCSLSQFSFTVAKSTDASYSFSLKQTSAAGVDSGSVTLVWTRDTVAPAVTLSSTPPAVNLAATASFAFSSNDSSATLQCQLDGASFVTCASPYALSSITNGSHTFTVRAIDTAGNITASPPSYTWSQESYKTVQLHHFDTSPGPTVDSSLYTGGVNNPLTDSGSSAGSTAKFGQSRAFNGTSSSMSAASTASQGLTTQTMTVEAFVKLAALPSNGKYMTIASKMGASGQYSWELRIRGSNGGKATLAFNVSLNGTTLTEVRSSPITLDTTTFRHFAVTWNKGSVAFFVNGASSGVGTVGTAGSSVLFSSTAATVLGKDASGNYLNGIIDELRISQIVRWSGSFTPPTAAYTAD